MAIFKLPKGKKKNDSDEIAYQLADQFQFDIASSSPRLGDDAKFTQAIEDTNNALLSKSSEFQPISSEQPYLNLYGMEILMMMYRTQLGVQDAASISNVGFSEFALTDSADGKKRKHATPVFAPVDSYVLTVSISNRLTHLPQLIAEFMFNYRDENEEDPGYDNKRDYVQQILKSYTDKYGELFKEMYGVLPSEAIVYPNEREYAQIVGQKKFLDIKAVVETLDDQDVTPTESTGGSVEFAEPTFTETTPAMNQEHDEQTVEVVQPEVQPIINAEPAATKQQFNAPKPQPLPTDNADIRNYLDQALTAAFDIHAADITIPLLEIAPYFSNLNEEDDDYPAAKISEFKEALNDERLSAENGLNASAQNKLVQIFKELNGDLFDAINKLENDERLEKTITEKINTELLERFTSERNRRGKEIDAEKERLMAQENSRHEEATRQIDEETATKHANLEDVIDAENEKLRPERIQTAMAAGQKQLTEKQQKIIDDTIAQTIASVESTISELKASSQEVISELMRDQNDRMAMRTDQLTAIHMAAIKTAAVKQRAEREAALQSDVDGVTEKMHDDMLTMGERMEQLRKERDKLTTENKTLRDFANEQSRPQTPQQPFMIPMVMPQHTEPQVNSNSGLKAAVIGLSVALGVLVLGGGGFAVYQSNARAADANSQIAALQASQNKQATSQTQATDADSESQTKSATTKSSSTPEMTNFDALDIDIANGSLAVYDQSFKNQDLKTEARVLAVGNSLIKAGRTDDAKALAEANDGHNTLLKQSIGQ
jgi:hypothetical protein